VLEVFASPARQEQIAELLAALRRWLDEAVVMNARLYEMDRAFFTKHIAPLFAGEEDNRPVVLGIDGPLLKKIMQQKLLLESEDVKIAPNHSSNFLSHQSAFRFSTPASAADKDRHDWNKKETAIGTGLAGVSFEVLPLVSSDRRYLRLQLSQEATQLIGIDKGKALDPLTGNEIDIEVPNVRNTSIKGTVQLLDGSPFIMPVAYRPPGKENEDKIWLLVARPMIWIEEEERERKKDGGEASPREIWNTDVPKDEEEQPKQGKPLPLDDQSKQILQAIIADVLTNPGLKHTRAFYGTPRDKTLALVDTEKFAWPKEFKPETHGHKLVEARRDPFGNQRRVLAIRLDKFDLKAKSEEEWPIEVCLYNTGGTANGAVIGGCTVYYVPKRVGDRWTVECGGLFDP
jgi:hypothetical protein